MLFAPETWSVLADVSLVFGLPFAIIAFYFERRKERQIQQEEIYQRISDEYTAFMKLIIENSDLHLLRAPVLTAPGTPEATLSEDQLERRAAFFSILVALFERAYLLVYDDRMNKETARLWQSWEDYMRDWVKRADFRSALPTLLQGEDQAFANHLARLALEQAAQQGQTPPNLQSFCAQ